MTEKPESKTLEDDDSKSIEYEIIESDRVDIVSDAVYFCRVMMERQCGHMADNAYAPGVELTEEEHATYVAALSFLQKTFTKGASKVRRVPKREDL